MGMFLFILISLKQLLYNVRIALFCKGSVDFFKVTKRMFDFITNKSIAKIPISHIMHSITPTMDGVLLLTESAK